MNTSTTPRTSAGHFRSRPPFRAEHVGSLLRPASVADARRAYQSGKLTAAELRAIEDAAIRDLVKMQEEVGLQSVTDGEVRRGSWHMDFLYRLGGVTPEKDGLKLRFHSDAGDVEFSGSTAKVTGRLTLPKPIFADDFAYLKSVSRAVPKLTIPSPSMIHYRGGRDAISRDVYPEMEAFWTDLKAVYAQEVAALGDLGCTYLQLDDTSLAYLADPSQHEHVRRLGGNPTTQHLTYIDLINGALANRPGDMTVCTHLCRGNFRSSWVASGGYDPVAEALFNELNVDGFYLEYDDERSGGFEPLRFVPKGKYVVLGLVTSKRAQLESKDEIKRRIDAAAKFVPLDQLCLSPQCGFASTAEGNAVTAADQRAKLQLVVEIAREVWGD
jgi:5-methyltetrahydropteroyltriglutamate--homocysteine methyltransferase